MAEAVGYALSQWRELSVFCSDGAVAIDVSVRFSPYRQMALSIPR
jgi:hypothetical protein